MKIEKEVTIFVESFMDAVKIVDKMDVSYFNTVIFMDEDEFYNGKCHVIIDKTMYMFMPVYKLFKEKEVFEKIVGVFENTISTSKLGLEVERLLVPYITQTKEEDNENVSDKVVDHSNTHNLDS